MKFFHYIYFLIAKFIFHTKRFLMEKNLQILDEKEILGKIIFMKKLFDDNFRSPIKNKKKLQCI